MYKCKYMYTYVYICKYVNMYICKNVFSSRGLKSHSGQLSIAAPKRN